jgi:hypothetical protein
MGREPGARRALHGALTVTNVTATMLKACRATIPAEPVDQLFQGSPIDFQHLSIVLPGRFSHLDFPWFFRFLCLMKLYRIVDVTQDVANTILLLDVQFQK